MSKRTAAASGFIDRDTIHTAELDFGRVKARVACNACRTKKSRCNGQQPCLGCVQSSTICVYRTMEMKQPQFSKLDRILSTVEKLEQFIRQGSHNGTSQTSPNGLRLKAEDTAIQSNVPPNHKSSTEHLISWEIFDNMPILRSTFRGLLQTELERPPISFLRDSEIPGSSDKERESLAEVYKASVNTWFPILSSSCVNQLMSMCSEITLETSCENCLFLLIMAVATGVQSISDEAPTIRSFAFFSSAEKMIHTAIADFSPCSTICLFLTTLVLNPFH